MKILIKNVLFNSVVAAITTSQAYDELPLKIASRKFKLVVNYQRISKKRNIQIE